MTLEKLIDGCKKGDRACYDSLVRQFAPKLMAVCYRYTKNEESAKDALQDTFMNVFKYIGGYKGRGSFEGWLRRIAVNCSLSFIKKNNTINTIEITHELTSDEMVIPDGFQQLEYEDMVTLLKRIPEHLYLVFNLYVIEGYSHKEIGEMLAIAESSSRSSLTRARVKIIELMKNELAHETLVSAKA